MPAKKPANKTATTATEKEAASESERGGGGDWFAGASAGVQEAARKLLNQIPPEARRNLIDQARRHGPEAAIMAIDATSRKVRGPKAKIALTALRTLLKALLPTTNKR